MTIREAHPAEYAALADLWEASVRATHDFLTEADIQGLRPKLIEDYLPAVTLRVHVSASGKIQGFVGVADEKVEMLFIAPEARGHGVGRKLLDYAITELSASLVDVNEQNPQAVGFYEHMGFEVFDRSPLDAQGQPFPILHMRLPSR